MSSITRAVQGARKRRQQTAVGRLRAAAKKASMGSTTTGPPQSALTATSMPSSRKGFGGIAAGANGGYARTSDGQYNANATPAPGTLESTSYPTIDKGVRESVHLAQPAGLSGKSLTGGAVEKKADVVKRDQPRTGGLSDLMKNARKRRGLRSQSY